MSTSEEYIRFVLEQLDGVEEVTCRKMFGEYLVYVRQRPVLLVCDNCVMVKKAPELAALMADAPEGVPYEGAKAHFVLDIENRQLTRAVIEVLVQITPVPKRKAERYRNKAYEGSKQHHRPDERLWAGVSRRKRGPSRVSGWACKGADDGGGICRRAGLHSAGRAVF